MIDPGFSYSTACLPVPPGVSLQVPGPFTLQIIPDCTVPSCRATRSTIHAADRNLLTPKEIARTATSNAESDTPLNTLGLEPQKRRPSKAPDQYKRPADLPYAFPHKNHDLRPSIFSLLTCILSHRSLPFSLHLNYSATCTFGRVAPAACKCYFELDFREMTVSGVKRRFGNLVSASGARKASRTEDFKFSR
jgi:hypothetical protein